MKYKVYIFCPNNQKVIDSIIEAAGQAGAGVMGTYTQAAFITNGKGQWFSGPGSHPTIGKVGVLTRIDEVRIEMEYVGNNIKKVDTAIRKVHPYEEPAIEFVKIENIT